MTLRSRVVLIVTSLVVAGIALASLAAYQTTANELTAETDRFLASRADEVLDGLRERPRERGDDRNGRGDEGGGGLELAFDPDAIAQSFDRAGEVTGSEGGDLPVEARDLEVAADGKSVIRDVDVEGERYRMITAPDGDGGAVQIARSTASTSDVLDRLAGRLALVGVVLAALAALLGWRLMRRTTRPLADLTAAAERVAETRDLTPLGSAGDDEVGRLARSFDGMLEALRTSREQQRRLVQDAGHELRTPLTSLRANVDFLRHADELPADERAEILAGVQSEIAELSTLVDEVVVLATDDSAADVAMTEIDLADVVTDAVAMFRRRTGREVAVSVEPTPLTGNAPLLDRAVSNLLGNAHKFSPPEQPIDVTLADRWVLVRDHGPGIDEDDGDRIFDRFHRAPAARSEPGSGLGLAIVRHVAEQHGGAVRARNVGGGAEIGFSVA